MRDLAATETRTRLDWLLLLGFALALAAAFALHPAFAEAEIVELLPGQRIVLHWQFVGPDRATDPTLATRLTVTFTAIPDGTQLDLIHDRLDGLRDRSPYIADGLRPGWASALAALAAVDW